MRSRGLVVAIAVVLAVLAAAGVIVYTNSLEESITTENTTEVVVSKARIEGNTALGPLVTAGTFDLIRVPNEAVVPGAITVIDDLSDETASTTILPNEQIPANRLASAEDAIQNLPVTEGNVGLGLSIAGPASVNGFITQGANVVVYATYPKGTAVTQESLRESLTSAQIQELFDSLTGTITNPADQPVILLPFDFTVTLIKSVKVIAIQNPPVDETTNRRSDGSTLLALDLTPEDASGLVFAIGHATLYMGLLPSENPDGYDTEATIGVPLARVTGVNER